MVQWLRLYASNAGDPGSNPSQGTRSCTPQLKIKDRVCHNKDLMKPNKQILFKKQNKTRMYPQVWVFEEFFRNSSAFTEGNCYIEGWPLSPPFQAWHQFAQKLSSCFRWNQETPSLSEGPLKFIGKETPGEFASCFPNTAGSQLPIRTRPQLKSMCVCKLNCIPLFVTPWIVCSPLASSVHGIFQTRILSELLFPPPGGLPDLGIEPASPAFSGGFFTTVPPGKPLI